MKVYGFILLLLFAALRPARAQEFELDMDQVNQALDVAQQLAKEHLDEDFLKSLPAVDRQKVEDFLKAFEAQLQGSNVVDLAQFKDTTRLILPLLDTYEETAPLAIWLRSRLDYFDVVEEIQKAQPIAPGRTVTNPAPATTMTVWVNKLSPTDWPKGAKELVPTLKPIFIREKVPPELVWVAEVESTFNPKARSPVGAAGLFQLMPATAQRFGLRSFPRDQRYQPEPSAEAAAKYLNYLGKKFGDWRLALAAYNSGEGTVERLLKKHNAKTFDAVAPKLPAETQLYVPKVEATVLKREGRALPRYGG